MIIVYALQIVLFLVLLFNIYLLIKVENSHKNQMKILNAIDAFAKDTNDCETALLALKEMEDFYKTLYRLLDWGYKNILPKEYFDLIEPYIQ